MLKANNITKSFESNTAVYNASLEISNGEIVCIIGHNGSGKSTLIKILTGWLKPDSGTLIIENNLLKSANPYKLQKRNIHLIPQEPAIFPHLTVLENIFAGNEIVLNKLFQIALWDKMEKEARLLLNRFGLINGFRLQQLAATLSGGEKTLLGFLRTLRLNPILLALDEPTASLGQSESKLIIKSLRQIADDGVGLLLVSHRLHEVIGLADRFIVMRNGQIVEQLQSHEANESQLAELAMR